MALSPAAETPLRRFSKRLLALAAPDDPDTGFTSDAWVGDGVADPIPMTHTWEVLGSWRLASIVMSTVWLLQLAFLYEVVTNPVVLLYLVFVAFISFPAIFILIYSALKRSPDAGDLTMKAYIIALPRGLKRALDTRILRLVTAASRYNKRLPWRMFWWLYSIFALSRKRFWQNYLNAWARTYPSWAIKVLVDGRDYMQISVPDPKDGSFDDAWLLRHLAFFYNLSRIHGGFLNVILPKTLIRVDVVELLPNNILGRRVSTMNWNAPYLQLVDDLRYVCTLEGDKRHVDGLVDGHVVRSVPSVGAPGTRPPDATSTTEDAANAPGPVPDATSTTEVAASPKALNLVLGWDSKLIAIVILTPTLISMATCAVWPIVAVLKYQADIQTSVQTGATVASYIVTAGGLLVALVTLFDTLTTRNSVGRAEYEAPT